MKPIMSLRFLALFSGSALFNISVVQAQSSGTWTQTGAGPFDWSAAATGNWSGGIVANGTNNTANFTANITAAQVVNLAENRTIGNITFTDDNNNLTISGANILTLDTASGLPVIDVSSGRTLTISSQISGSVGLQKNGTGTLALTGANNYTGGTNITGGILSVTAASKTTLEQAAGLAPLSLSGGGRLTISSVNVASTSQVSVGTGGGLISVNGNNNFTTTGKLTGSGTLTQADPGGAGGRSLNFNATNNDFTGGITINGANALTVQVNSLLDTANNIVFNNNGTNNGTNGFTYGAGALVPLTLTNRAFEINSNNLHTTTINNLNTTQAMTVNTNLIATGSGAKQLTLSAANGPINIFDGDITNGTGGGTIGLLHNSGTWELTGSNTYSGDTLVNVTLTMRGTAAVSPNTKFRMGGTDGSAGNSDTIRIFTDDAGTVNLGNQLDLRSVQTSATANWVVNVGNNGGATTGSTIALGKVNFAFTTDNRANGLIFNTTGANGYKVQVSDIDVSINQANPNRLNPTTAPLTVAGSIKQINGKAASYLANGANVTYRADYFELDGTATGNLVSGVIKDAADYDNSSNLNARPLNIVKRNNSTWTLSNTNTYAGATYVNGGTLIINDLQNGGTASSIGESSSASNNLVLGSGTLQYAPISGLGATGSTTDRNFTLTGNGTIDSSGTGALVFSQTNTISPDGVPQTGTSTAGSAVITGLTSTAGLAIGMVMNGTGIPAGRTIISIDSPTQITLNSGTSVTAGTNSFNFGYGNRTLTLAGTNTGANTIAGNLQNSTAAGIGVLSLTKAGTGVWKLSGGNIYTGATAVNGGMLVYLNTGAKAPGTATAASAGSIGLGVGGAGFYSSADVDSLFANTLAGFSMNAISGVGIDTSAGNFTYTTNQTNDRVLTKLGANTLSLTGTASTRNAPTTVLEGTLSVTKLADGGVASSIGDSTAAANNLLLGNGTTLRYTGTGDSTDRSFTINGIAAGHGATIDASGTGALSLTSTASPAYGTTDQTRQLTLTGNNTGLNTLAANIADNGTGAVSLAKTGVGTWIATGTNTYSGTTTIAGGTLAINGTGSINGSSGVTINGGTLRYNSSVNLSSPVTFTTGTIGGTNLNGTLGNLSIGTGRTLSPGNSPGIANTINQTWADGGNYTWEINNATGTAGSDPGWDLLFGTGTLAIDDSTASPFTIAVTSLTAGNLPGNAVNFLDTLSQNWLIADFANPVTGFNPTAFAIDTSAFTNPFTGSWVVALGGTGSLPGNSSDVYLSYVSATALIPEPSRALLGLLALLPIALRRRR